MYFVMYAHAHRYLFILIPLVKGFGDHGGFCWALSVGTAVYMYGVLFQSLLNLKLKTFLG